MQVISLTYCLLIIQCLLLHALAHVVILLLTLAVNQLLSYARFIIDVL